MTAPTPAGAAVSGDATPPGPEAPAAPAPETPAPETPSAATPAPDTPAAETPAPDTPAVETPAADPPAPGVPAPAPFSRWYLRRDLRRVNQHWDQACEALDALESEQLGAATPGAAPETAVRPVTPSHAATRPPAGVVTLRGPAALVATLLVAWSVHPLVDQLVGDRTLPAAAASLLTATALVGGLIVAAVLALDDGATQAPTTRTLAWPGLAVLWALLPILAVLRGVQTPKADIVATVALAAVLVAAGSTLVLLRVPGDADTPTWTDRWRPRVPDPSALARRRASRRAHSAVRRYLNTYGEAVQRCAQACATIPDAGERTRLLGLLQPRQVGDPQQRSAVLPLGEPLELAVAGLVSRDPRLLLARLPATAAVAAVQSVSAVVSAAVSTGVQFGPAAGQPAPANAIDVRDPASLAPPSTGGG